MNKIISTILCTLFFINTNAQKEYETPLKDSRDGQVYKTVKIDDQIWMAENLRYDAGENSYLNPANPSNKYGYLYTATIAKEVCPADWHLPLLSEWHKLIDEAGGKQVAAKNLKSTSGWRTKNIDTLNFSVLPAGYRAKSFYLLGNYASFWTADSQLANSTKAWARHLTDYADDIFLNFEDKSIGHSVRCVKNFLPIIEEQISPKEPLKDTRNGEIYKTVQIGTQTWMSENLRYNTEGAYLNTENPSKKFGYLYSWDAAVKVCPTEWHLPTDEDWKILMLHLGMSLNEANLTTWLSRESGNVGKKLKSTYGWHEYHNGLDSIGFAALPVGKYMNDSFLDLGKDARFWSATEKSSSVARMLSLHYSHDGITHGDLSKWIGISVRCIKD